MSLLEKFSELPIKQSGALVEINELLTLHKSVDSARVVIVSAQTGSGKSCAIGPTLMQEEHNVMVSVPTISAVLSLMESAKRNLEADFPELYRRVGWACEGDLHYDHAIHRMVYATTQHVCNWMIRLLADKKFEELERYTIMIDEAHHSSRENHLLIQLVKYCVNVLELKLNVIISSATLDSATGLTGWKVPPIQVEVPGRIHQITYEWSPRDYEWSNKDQLENLMEATAQVIVNVLEVRERRCDILVFIDGEDTMRMLHDELLEQLEHPERVKLIHFFGGMDPETRTELFSEAVQREDITDPDRIRRVILATNAAESAITLPTIRVVVDTGLEKAVVPDKVDETRDCLERRECSRDSLTQRAGRAGRTGPGLVIRLMTRRGFDRRIPAYHDSEVLAPDLSIIQLLARGLPASLVMELSTERWDRSIARMLEWKLIQKNPFYDETPEEEETTATEGGGEGEAAAEVEEAADAEAIAHPEPLYLPTELGIETARYPLSIMGGRTMAYAYNPKNWDLMRRNDLDLARFTQWALTWVLSLSEVSSGGYLFYVPFEKRRPDEYYEYLRHTFYSYRSDWDPEMYARILLDLVRSWPGLENDRDTLHWISRWALDHSFNGKTITRAIRQMCRLRSLGLKRPLMPIHRMMQQLYNDLNEMEIPRQSEETPYGAFPAMDWIYQILSKGTTNRFKYCKLRKTLGWVESCRVDQYLAQKAEYQAALDAGTEASSLRRPAVPPVWILNKRDTVAMPGMEAHPALELVEDDTPIEIGSLRPFIVSRRCILGGTFPII